MDDFELNDVPDSVIEAEIALHEECAEIYCEAQGGAFEGELDASNWTHPAHFAAACDGAAEWAIARKRACRWSADSGEYYGIPF